jgi:cell division protein FtsQ
MLIMKQYQVLSQAISPYGMNIVELEENQLGIWTLRLDNEWKLLAGRTNVVKKVQQLMQMLAENKISQQNQIKTIDMRYENGLAIKWKQEELHSKQLKSIELDNGEQNI